MQNRLMQRFLAHFSIIIYYRNKPIMMGDTANICSKGVFVKTNQARDIPDDDLEIGFEYGSNGSGRVYKLPVRAIHRNKKGIGLEYKEITNDDDLFTHTLLGYISRTHKIRRQHIH